MKNKKGSAWGWIIILLFFIGIIYAISLATGLLVALLICLGSILGTGIIVLGVWLTLGDDE